MASDSRCRSCGCELQPWESDFCEGCGPLFLQATKGNTMSNATVKLTIDDECTVFADGQAVEFVEWAGPNTDGREDDAYHIADFFGPDGKYLGPDQHGTHPVFAIA